MATLTADRRAGKVVGYNIQWCENRRRYTIYLSTNTPKDNKFYKISPDQF